MEMEFCRSEASKAWEHLLLPLPLSLLWARTFLKLWDHPALNEDQAVPGELWCVPQQGEEPSWAAPIPAGTTTSSQLIPFLLQQTPHTRMSLLPR